VTGWISSRSVVGWETAHTLYSRIIFFTAESNEQVNAC